VDRFEDRSDSNAWSWAFTLWQGFPPKILTFHICDVFTDRPFAGNPLAILPGADGLTGAQMQDAGVDSM
jgi:hypothetical protein